MHPARTAPFAHTLRRMVALGGLLLLLSAALLAMWSAPAQAQSAAAAAQADYNQRVAQCDTSQPRPVYNACIRAAGAALDRTGTMSNGSTQSESADGRSTILQPPGAQGPNLDPSAVMPETTTSQDGRSTLLVPSDSIMRNGATR